MQGRYIEMNRLLLFYSYMLILSFLTTGNSLLAMEEKPFSLKADYKLQEYSQDTLPQGYKHKPVQEQISVYHSIYNKKSLESLATFHVEGLFPVLQNGFALVHDYLLTSSKTHGERIRAQGQIKELEQLYKIAVENNKNKKMTHNRFILLNYGLALIADLYKEVFTGTTTKEALKSLLQGDFSLHPRIYPILEDPFYVPIVIYTNRESKISPVTFVDQDLNYDYRGKLALFDVNSNVFKTMINDQPIFIGTKKDPHYSYHNGTFRLFKHDMMHHVEQMRMERELLSKTCSPFGVTRCDVDWPRWLKFANQVRLAWKDKNDNYYRILTNGLFILSHELFNVMRKTRDFSDDKVEGYDVLSSTYIPENSGFFDIIDYIRDNMIAFTLNIKRSSFLYKVDYRDFEYAVRDITNLDRKPLLPHKSSLLKTESSSETDNKTATEAMHAEYHKALAHAYVEFWKMFTQLLQDSIVKIMENT